MKLRLKGIIQDADFRYSELTLYEKYLRSKAYGGELGTNETYLFVSRSGNQLVWVLHYEPDVLVQKTKRRRIESLRMRISGGYWNPLMLQNYANEVGIELEGIKRFEEAFKEKQERKKR
jgi:hypothetical protein